MNGSPNQAKGSDGLRCGSSTASTAGLGPRDIPDGRADGVVENSHPIPSSPAPIPQSMFKVRNFVLGCMVGVFTALVVFIAGFCVQSTRWPIPFTTETVRALLRFISWPWFVGIVLAGGIWGFLFNNKIGESLSRAERHSRWLRR